MPAGVRSTRRVVRTNRGACSSLSRERMVADSPDWGDVEPGSSSGEVAFLGHRDESLQLAELHSASIVLSTI